MPIIELEFWTDFAENFQPLNHFRAKFHAVIDLCPTIKDVAFSSALSLVN